MVQERATKRCPMCAEDVWEEARICRYCRHEFTGAPWSAATAPAPAPASPSVTAAWKADLAHGELGQWTVGSTADTDLAGAVVQLRMTPRGLGIIGPQASRLLRSPFLRAGVHGDLLVIYEGPEHYMNLSPLQGQDPAAVTESIDARLSRPEAAKSHEGVSPYDAPRVVTQPPNPAWEPERPVAVQAPERRVSDIVALLATAVAVVALFLPIGQTNGLLQISLTAMQLAGQATEWAVVVAAAVIALVAAAGFVISPGGGVASVLRGICGLAAAGTAAVWILSLLSFSSGGGSELDQLARAVISPGIGLWMGGGGSIVAVGACVARAF